MEETTRKGVVEWFWLYEEFRGMTAGNSHERVSYAAEVDDNVGDDAAVVVESYGLGHRRQDVGRDQCIRRCFFCEELGRGVV